MSIVSSLLARVGLAGLAGMQFGGKRDLYKIYGYKRQLTYDDYYAKYTRQDVAKRVVNAPATATWRNPPELETENQALKDAWLNIVEKHQIWSQIERVDRLAGLGHYAVLMLGFNDGAASDQPVRYSTGNELLYIQPYSQASVKISAIEENTSSPRFGMPKMYEIRMSDPLALANYQGEVMSSSVKTRTINVHYSRIVHIAEELNESNFIGTPRLQAVYNLLDDLLKISGGTAETYWLTSNRGMQIDVDKDAELSAQDAEALSAEVEEYQHELRRFLRTKGVKVTNLGGSTPDPRNAFAMNISLISGATGIPQRILMGSEAGQLASDQDRANWSDRIKERRTTFAEPNVLNPLTVALMEAGVLPQVELPDYKYVWPPNFQLTPLEEAQTMAQRARAAINLAKHFKDGNPLMTVTEARIIIGLPGIPPEKLPTPPKVPPKTDNGATTRNRDTDNQPNDY